MSTREALTITLERPALDVLRRYSSKKRAWFAEGGATPNGQRLERQVLEAQDNLAILIERLASRVPPSNVSCPLERAQKCIDRIAEAKTVRDVDHIESVAMGYLAALRDEGLLTESEHARLTNTLRGQRLAWKKTA